MAWAKFDDKAFRNRKVRRVARREPAAALLWMFAIIYCCEQQTDGEIEADELSELLPVYHEDYARLLVSERLLHDAPGCPSPACLGSQGLPIAGSGLYVVHDFADTQMLSAEWADYEQRKREKAAYAAHKRWHVDRGLIAEDCVLCHAQSDATSNATGTT
jgi:hypothetical protein